MMKPAQRVALALAALVAGLPALAQMHRVTTPDQVTRAVGVYEYVGDPLHPKAARLIPVSLFIGGHFEDADLYLARPVPFALDGGLRYELQNGGVPQDFFDVVASRHLTSTTAGAASPFDETWFGYGRVVPPPAPKAVKLRPNCGNAHVVQEADSSNKTDGKPHFGSTPTPDNTQAQRSRNHRAAAPDPCRDEPEYASNDDKPERVTLADDTRDKDAPDPERPTLHRSPETTAHNTGAEGKPDKKAPKPPPATITSNEGPADDPDRPTIRHRTTDENDPNALPPDPIDLVSRASSPATVKGVSDGTAALGMTASANDTIADGGTITAGNTSAGGPVLRRGRMATPALPSATPRDAGASAPASLGGKQMTSTIPAPLAAMVAVSDAKSRAPHDYRYQFSSATERAAVLNSLQTMAKVVLANPALASDAPDGTPSTPTVTTPAPAPATAGGPHAHRTGSHTTARSIPVHKKSFAAGPAAPPALTDDDMKAFQLYYGAPVTYIYSAHVAATTTTPERFVTVIAQTDAEGKLQPAFRSVTDAQHLDRVPRYRLIDVVDADGSNRASLLMELRAQHSRQFALYRLLGTKPDQIFLGGTTLL